MRARSDVFWLVAIMIVMAIVMQMLRTQRARAEAESSFPPPAAAAPAPGPALPASLFGAEPDASTMWIPMSNVTTRTASTMVRAQYRDVKVACYGPHLMKVTGAPTAVYKVSAFCRRLDQPTDVTAWCQPQE